MTVSIYDVSIAPMLRALGNLTAMLAKAEQHATEKKFESSVLVQSRLFPDMLPLSSQVQIACDMAKGGASRLAAVDPPKFEDNEKSIAELKDRIAKTIDFIRSLDKSKFDNAETRDITMKIPQRELRFKGLAYVTDFVLPNIYFHAATTYALLRHNGVALGKGDFLGSV